MHEGQFVVRIHLRQLTRVAFSFFHHFSVFWLRALDQAGFTAQYSFFVKTLLLPDAYFIFCNC